MCGHARGLELTSDAQPYHGDSGMYKERHSKCIGKLLTMM